MRRLDVSEFMQEVLAELDDVPEGFGQRLVGLMSSAPTTRWMRIRDLISEVTRG